jgi:hypothetical protein
MVLGNVPDARTRQTLSARLRQALPAATYAEADYRRYVDDWQVKSNTVSVGLSHYVRPAVLFGFTYRRYDQTGAFFWAPQYTGTPQYYRRISDSSHSRRIRIREDSRSHPRDRGGCCRRAPPSPCSTSATRLTTDLMRRSCRRGFACR